MSDTFLRKESARAAVAHAGAAVVASLRPYPVCGEPMTRRKTSACSDTCRAAKSRQGKVVRWAERKRAVRELLRRALAKLEERHSEKGGAT